MEVELTNTGRRTCSPWATYTGTPKENRQISTFHSTGGALRLSFVVNIALIYRVIIRIRVRVSVRVNSNLIMVAFYNMLPRPVGRLLGDRL